MSVSGEMASRGPAIQPTRSPGKTTLERVPTYRTRPFASMDLMGRTACPPYGLAVYRVAGDRLGHNWTKADRAKLETAAARFVESTDGVTPIIDVAKLAKGMAVASVIPATLLIGPLAGTTAVATATVLDAGSWKLSLGLPGRSAPQDQEERVRALLGAVNHLIGTVQADYRAVTVLVDGLDRIAREETTRELFVESTLLGSLESQATVMTGSVMLRRAGLAGRVRRFEAKVLANAPVLDLKDPTRDGSGIAFLSDVYGQRVGARGVGAFPSQLLSQVARCSGGRVREFVRMIRLVAERMWDLDEAVATQPAVDAAIDERRRLAEMGIHEGHIEVLRGVIETKTLPDSDLVPQLLDRFWLLPYPNDSEWYYPHPLLTMKRM